MEQCPPFAGGHCVALGRLRRSGLGLLGGAVEGVAEGVAHLVGTEPKLGKREHEAIGGDRNAFAAFTERFGVRRLVGDERAGSAAGEDGAVGFEFSVGAATVPGAMSSAAASSRNRRSRLPGSSRPTATITEIWPRNCSNRGTALADSIRMTMRRSSPARSV